MTCEICGRGSCTKAFHSSEAQEAFDDVADSVKDTAKSIIAHRLDRLDVEWVEDEQYIKLSDALDVVDDYS